MPYDFTLGHLDVLMTGHLASPRARSRRKRRRREEKKWRIGIKRRKERIKEKKGGKMKRERKGKCAESEREEGQ